MKKLKRILLTLTVAIAIVPLLASCMRINIPQATPEYSEQPTVTPGLTPEPSETPIPSLTPSSAPELLDASDLKPVYNNTNRPHYDIQVAYNDKKHTAAASQTVKYTNTSADSMSELYMHIYPNHFSRKEYVGMDFMGYPVYPDDKFDAGSISIKSVKAGGSDADFTVQGEDETVLKIPLEMPLMKGSSIELSLEYNLKVPHCTGRYAWGDAGVSFGNWYPIMAMYDKDGWNLDQYYELGDPFYSETADYNVTLDIPEGMEAAFTGDVVSDVTADGRRTLALSETGVRDFAFVLSNDYYIETEYSEGIEVRVAIPSEYKDLADDVLGYAGKSLSLYGSRFGKYTNDTFTVVFSDFFSGMEYPGLVMISADYFETEDVAPTIERVVAHETGHQWWYSAVGNDEVDESWLDESLTSFTTLMYYGDKFGWDALSLEPAAPEKDMALDAPLTAFNGWSDYVYIYSFGELFFKVLMDKMGENEFYTMLQKYYATYAYEIATSEDLRRLVAEYGDADALDWYDLCVYGK